jgi:uridylate kinase
VAGPTYRRLLLKLSGEALTGRQAHGIDQATLARICRDIKEARELGIEVAVVVGGGNIFRGMQGVAGGMERGTADYMGMLATVMNALALRGALEALGVPARTQSAIPMPTVCEPFLPERARRHLAKGRVVVFGGGTGNPYFTTDTAATLRAVEMGCDALAKATQVDGVYTADPRRDASARRYESVSYDEVLAKDLKVMDGAAIALARDNALPIIVFSIENEGNLASVLKGEGRSTIVR